MFRPMMPPPQMTTSAVCGVAVEKARASCLAAGRSAAPMMLRRERDLDASIAVTGESSTLCLHGAKRRPMGVDWLAAVSANRSGICAAGVFISRSFASWASLATCLDLLKTFSRQNAYSSSGLAPLKASWSYCSTLSTITAPALVTPSGMKLTAGRPPGMVVCAISCASAFAKGRFAAPMMWLHRTSLAISTVIRLDFEQGTMASTSSFHQGSSRSEMLMQPSMSARLRRTSMV
mmetsp:Transcript_13409/g.49829  ORF Transcript_13409/g.49829 Transcript_13409/m.49829 type:complete len:234 (+) Transcript_13409:608-1309(+)